MIQLLKLVTGEELIADISFNKESNSYALKKPIRIIITQEGGGFAPFMPFMDDDTVVNISANNIVFAVNPLDKIVTEYCNVTGNLVVPPKGLVLG